MPHPIRTTDAAIRDAAPAPLTHPDEAIARAKWSAIVDPGHTEATAGHQDLILRVAAVVCELPPGILLTRWRFLAGNLSYRRASAALLIEAPARFTQ